MKIKLPLNINQTYIVVPWKEHTLAIFKKKNFFHFQRHIFSQMDERKRSALHNIMAYSHYMEYDYGWDIPESLLAYMKYKGNIEIIEYNTDYKSPLYIIKNPD